MRVGAGVPVREEGVFAPAAENLFVSPKLILPCVALGLATFTMQASESVISVCFNASLLKYGGDIAVGAMTILTSVMQFAMLPLQGIGQARSRSRATTSAQRTPTACAKRSVCC